MPCIFVLHFFPSSEGYQEIYYPYEQASNQHSILTKICLHFDVPHRSFPILELWVCHSNLFSSILFFFVFSRWKLQLKCMIAMTCLLQRINLDISTKHHFKIQVLCTAELAIFRAGLKRIWLHFRPHLINIPGYEKAIIFGAK